MIEILTNPLSLPLFPALGFILGSVLGSFLNVCAHRIPNGQSVVLPGSHCPCCGTSIPWFRNLPVFSWVYQMGRADCCSFIIPVRYLLVELVMGAFFAYFAYLYVMDGDVVSLLSCCVFSWIMVTIIVIDYETMLIPDRLSIGGAFVGLVMAFFFPEFKEISPGSSWLTHFSSCLDALLGLFVGSALLYWIGALGYVLFNREALGEGDIKLLGCIGAFCGWQGAVFSIFGGAFLGSVILIPLMIFQRIFFKSKTSVESGAKLVMGAEVPFGPYLAVAGLFYFLGASTYVDSFFEPILWLFNTI